MTRAKEKSKKATAPYLPPWAPAALCAIALAVLAALIYWQTFSFAFVSLDDIDYVPRNPLVQDGLTLESIKAALTSRHQNFWIPATWISYMADMELWGGDAGAFHRTNVILFAFGASLLFFFLRELTGSTPKSFFIAALWASHPLRVESVAWVTERKDLLVGIFFILALWSHLKWVASRRYKWQAALFCFALLGFMSKPIMVVLPVALLLLDFWPLGRFSGEEGVFSLKKAKGLLVEKIPAISLSALFVGVTIYTQIFKNSLPSKTDAYNLAVAATSYMRYIERTLWPAGAFMEKAQMRTAEAAFYAALFAVVLAAITWGAWRARKNAPELMFGWLWFVLVLLPNSGIVSIGLQTYSDRFAFLPHIGLFTALVFGAERLARRLRLDLRLLAAPAAITIIIFSIVSFRMAGYWKDSVTLFTHMDEVSGGTNAMAKNSLATECMERGDNWGAVRYLNEVEKIQPYYPYLKYNMALALHQLGRDEEALRQINQDACPQAKDKSQSIALRAEILESLRQKGWRPQTKR